MNSSHNNPETFRELSLLDLKEYAKRWAEKFSDIPVLKVRLYRYSSKFQKYTSPNKRLPHKYAVIFEVPHNVQCAFKSYDGINIDPTGSYSPEEHKKLLPDYSEAYEKLVAATEEYFTMSHGDKYLDLLDARFKDAVYIQSPHDNFEDDWYFATKEPEEQLSANILIYEPHWILYLAPRLSIEIIAELLKQDLLYCDDAYCEGVCDWLINKYTTTENPWNSKDGEYVDNHAKKMQPIEILQEKGENSPWQKYFLHLLCLYSGLNTYQPGEQEPTEWAGLEYVEKCSENIEIDRSELRTILQGQEFAYKMPASPEEQGIHKGLPLPAFWYEDEKNNTKGVAANGLIKELTDIESGKLPKFDLEVSIKDALRNKYIDLGLLPYVMASDEQYTPDLLIRLWKKYQCDRRGPKKPPLETYENRAGVWFHIFERLAFGRVQGIPVVRSSPPYLPLYQFNYEEGVLEKYDRRKDSGNPQVKLEDLEKYLSEMIEIPLPAQLFSKDIETKSISQKDHGIIGNNDELIKTISGDLLMKTWGIGAHELLQLIISGLHALKPDYKPLIDGILSGDIRETAIRRFLGKHPEKAVSNLLFSITDLQEYKNKHPELPPIEISPRKDSHDSGIQVEKQKTGKNQLLPCAPGTKWEDIRITLIANDTVRIRTPEGEKRFTYHELGLSDKRKGDTPKILWPLLVLFAKHSGHISSNENEFVKNLPDKTKRLNKHLKDLFRISDSIFKEHYKKHKGYKTKIQFFDRTQTPIERPTSRSIREEIFDEFEEAQNKFLNN